MVVQISKATLFPLLLILCLAVSSVFGRATSIPAASTEDDRISSGLIGSDEVFIEVSVHIHKSALDSYAYKDKDAFWKTVDTYFKFFNHPKIHILHNDTQILDDYADIRYYNFGYNNGSKIYAETVWSRFQRYAYKKSRLNQDYDISLLVTRSELCSLMDVRRCDITAVAPREATCRSSDNSEESESVAVVRSGRTYFEEMKNVIFAIGLLLGAETENQGGYFMSNTQNPANWEIGWSRESLNKISNFVHFRNGSSYSEHACFINKPNPDWEKKYNETNLPGLRIHIDDYCKQITGNPNSKACYTGDKLCRSMQCVREGDKCLNVGPAPEGSWCADPNYRCQYGKCEPWLSQKSDWDLFIEGYIRALSSPKIQTFRAYM